MSFSASAFSKWFHTTETEVVAIIAKIKADVVVAEHDLHAALTWIGSEVPNIVAGLQTALGLAEAVGVVTAPELAAANAAVYALNAFAHAQAAAKAGGDGALTVDAKSVVAGYVAYNQAAAAVNSAKAVAASAGFAVAPAPVAAPAPTTSGTFAPVDGSAG